MKTLTTLLLTLLLSGSLWAVDLDAACRDGVNTPKCQSAIDLVFGKETRKEDKNPKGKKISSQEFKTLNKGRNPYKNYSNPKAVAIGGHKGNLKGYMCYSHSSLSSSVSCALDGCEAQGEACAIILENNSWVDKEVIKKNLDRARRNFSNDSNSEDSQSNSSFVSECLKSMEESRKQEMKRCGLSYKTEEGGLGGYIAKATYCKNRANQQYPDAICYGAKAPDPLPPINSAKVCNFKDSITGIVIQGDCNKSTIWIGNTPYKKF